MPPSPSPPPRNYTGPQKSAAEGKGSSRAKSAKYNPHMIEIDEDSHSRYMSDSRRYTTMDRDVEDSEVRPRAGGDTENFIHSL